MDKLKIICILALFCSTLSLLPAIGADAKERPDFSGHWRLNTFISDDPIEEMNKATREMLRSERISERGPRRLGRGGLGVGNVMRGETGARGEREDVEIRFQNIQLSARTLEITHEEPELIIRYPGGREVTLFTDGRVEKREWGFGPVETRARWKKKGKLVVKSTDDEGRTTTEKYELTFEGKQLKLVTDVEGHRPAPSFNYTRFYDLTPPEKTETED